MIISVGGSFLVCLYIGSIENYEYYNVMTWTLNQAVFWISPHLLIPATCVMIDFLYHACKMFFTADNLMVLREKELEIGSNSCLWLNVHSWLQKVIPSEHEDKAMSEEHVADQMRDK